MKLYRCDLCGRVFHEITPHVCVHGKYRKVWECVDKPNITQNNWLAEEYITKIEELNDENKN